MHIGGSFVLYAIAARLAAPLNMHGWCRSLRPWGKQRRGPTVPHSLLPPGDFRRNQMGWRSHEQRRWLRLAPGNDRCPIGQPKSTSSLGFAGCTPILGLAKDLDR